MDIHVHCWDGALDLWVVTADGEIVGGPMPEAEAKALARRLER